MPINYDQPIWASYFSQQLIIAQSTRLGGFSKPPYASLNLGLHTPDNEKNVLENRQRFCTDLGVDALDLAGGFQVHGNEVLRVNEPGQREGYDAFITNEAGVILSVTIADCCPILLYDPVRQAVGAAHAGWKGTIGQIAARTLEAMCDAYGTLPADCWAYLGTCIGADDFEVDADVADYFEDTYKRWKPSTKKYHLDLKAASRDQLQKLGVPLSQLECSAYSTVTHNDRYFSHRAEKGKTGRMLAVIGMRKEQCS
jgi:YfiH family protein